MLSSFDLDDLPYLRSVLSSQVENKRRGDVDSLLKLLRVLCPQPKLRQLVSELIKTAEPFALRRAFLSTAPLDQVLPSSVLCHAVSYLDSSMLGTLLCVSKNMQRMLHSVADRLFQSYSVVLCDTPLKSIITRPPSKESIVLSHRSHSCVTFTKPYALLKTGHHLSCVVAGLNREVLRFFEDVPRLNRGESMTTRSSTVSSGDTHLSSHSSDFHQLSEYSKYRYLFKHGFRRDPFSISPLSSHGGHTTPLPKFSAEEVGSAVSSRLSSRRSSLATVESRGSSSPRVSSEVLIHHEDDGDDQDGDRDDEVGQSLVKQTGLRLVGTSVPWQYARQWVVFGQPILHGRMPFHRQYPWTIDTRPLRGMSVGVLDEIQGRTRTPRIARSPPRLLSKSSKFVDVPPTGFVYPRLEWRSSSEKSAKGTVSTAISSSSSVTDSSAKLPTLESRAYSSSSYSSRISDSIVSITDISELNFEIDWLSAQVLSQPAAAAPSEMATVSSQFADSLEAVSHWSSMYSAFLSSLDNPTHSSGISMLHPTDWLERWLCMRMNRSSKGGRRSTLTSSTTPIPSSTVGGTYDSSSASFSSASSSSSSSMLLNGRIHSDVHSKGQLLRDNCIVYALNEHSKTLVERIVYIPPGMDQSDDDIKPFLNTHLLSDDPRCNAVMASNKEWQRFMNVSWDSSVFCVGWLMDGLRALRMWHSWPATKQSEWLHSSKQFLKKHEFEMKLHYIREFRSPDNQQRWELEMNDKFEYWKRQNMLPKGLDEASGMMSAAKESIRTLSVHFPPPNTRVLNDWGLPFRNCRSLSIKHQCCDDVSKWLKPRHFPSLVALELLDILHRKNPEFVSKVVRQVREQEWEPDMVLDCGNQSESPSKTTIPMLSRILRSFNGHSLRVLCLSNYISSDSLTENVTWKIPSTVECLCLGKLPDCVALDLRDCSHFLWIEFLELKARRRKSSHGSRFIGLYAYQSRIKWKSDVRIECVLTNCATLASKLGFSKAISNVDSERESLETNRTLDILNRRCNLVVYQGWLYKDKRVVSTVPDMISMGSDLINTPDMRRSKPKKQSGLRKFEDMIDASDPSEGYLIDLVQRWFPERLSGTIDPRFRSMLPQMDIKVIVSRYDGLFMAVSKLLLRRVVLNKYEDSRDAKHLKARSVYDELLELETPKWLFQLSEMRQILRVASH